ncbi:hypothetical protein RRF57_001701 [Xylaria bambusicola]|uniref:Uncharacterized protein n=1 Tax=Xylaria bambusicola TaxID=326684 RepID=A0AAN7YV39_9PEZI
MPAPYHRHAAITASTATGSGAHVAHRPGVSRGHISTWSTSSNDELAAKPMSLATPDDEFPNPASTTTSLLDDSYTKQQGPSWAFLTRRVR